MKNPLLMDDQIDWNIDVAGLLAGNCGEQAADGLWLHQGISELHAALSTHPQFEHARQIALNHPPSSDSQSHWLPLLETAKVKIGLLCLYRFTHIPLHDHPGSFGAQLVLSGRIHLSQYHQARDSDSDQHVVKLIKDTDQAIGMAESATYTPRVRNLHVMQGLSSRCVLLSLMTDPYHERDRSWYFPVNCFRQEQTIYYRRMKSMRRPVSSKR